MTAPLAVRDILSQLPMPLASAEFDAKMRLRRVGYAATVRHAAAASWRRKIHKWIVIWGPRVPDVLVPSEVKIYKIADV